MTGHVSSWYYKNKSQGKKDNIGYNNDKKRVKLINILGC